MSFPAVVLESAAHRTLHAQGFSRSSVQASQVLTDLFSRYLTLLATTCAQYAQHAGRTRLATRDAFAALEELGVGTAELAEYCTSEGREMRRFALHTARRVEDLNELKAQNADGLRQDEDDAIPLVYAPLPPTITEESEDELDEDVEEEASSSIPHRVQDNYTENMDVDAPWPNDRDVISRWPGRWTPAVPSSPVSFPSSPTRKRPRWSNWSPPDHIPQFLPPFPDESELIDRQPAPPSPQMPPVQVPLAKIEKPPSPIPQPLASASAPDYLTRVPYEQSTLSATPEWHLPEPPPLPQPSSQTKPSRTAALQTEPAFIAAYHHILTHPPPPGAAYASPSRHKVAMALLARTQIASRWDSPDTLYSNVAPCTPRVAAMSPTFPIPISKGPPGSMDNKAEETKFPATLGKCVVAQERLSPSVSQPGSRLPELSRAVLSTTVHTRTTRLTHPPVLANNGQKLVYGTGLPAPWNSAAPTAPSFVPPGKANEGAAINGIVNDKSKDAVKPALPDALLYATWDFEKKDYRQPLHTSGRRGRVGSIPVNANPILVGMRSRQGSQGSKVG